MDYSAKFCPQCGHELSGPNSVFCGECGERIIALLVENAGEPSLNIENLDVAPSVDYYPNRMVSFPQAVKLGCLNYFNFRGRSTRAEFWWWMLFGFLTNIAVGIIDIILLLIINPEILLGMASGDNSNIGLGTLWNIVLWIPGVAVTVRRLHDVNQSGWWVYAPYIGLGVLLGLWGLVFFQVALMEVTALLTGLAVLAYLVYVVLIIVFCATKGNVGPNKYGPDPQLYSNN